MIRCQVLERALVLREHYCKEQGFQGTGILFTLHRHCRHVDT